VLVVRCVDATVGVRLEAVRRALLAVVLDRLGHYVLRRDLVGEALDRDAVEPAAGQRAVQEPLAVVPIAIPSAAITSPGTGRPSTMTMWPSTMRTVGWSCSRRQQRPEARSTTIRPLGPSPAALTSI